MIERSRLNERLPELAPYQMLKCHKKKTRSNKYLILFKLYYILGSFIYLCIMPSRWGCCHVMIQRAWSCTVIPIQLPYLSIYILLNLFSSCSRLVLVLKGLSLDIEQPTINRSTNIGTDCCKQTAILSFPWELL